MVYDPGMLLRLSVALVAVFAAMATPAYAVNHCGSGDSAWNGLYVSDVRSEGVGCSTAHKVARRARFGEGKTETRIAGRVWTCVVTKFAAAPVSPGDHRTHVLCRSRGAAVRFYAAS